MCGNLTRLLFVGAVADGMTSSFFKHTFAIRYIWKWVSSNCYPKVLHLASTCLFVGLKVTICICSVCRIINIKKWKDANIEGQLFIVKVVPEIIICGIGNKYCTKFVSGLYIYVQCNKLQRCIVLPFLYYHPKFIFF